MCGIAGTINLNNPNLELIKNSLLHRGPDEQAIHKHKNINLIHTRLSIQDISNGHQPFEYKEYVIVFNGEIYNHLDLRQEYLRDFSFTTNSDTETLLYLYIKYQNKMFDMLDGMFAFAILNKSSNKIIFSRDRAGKKPLYVYKDSDSLMFASELNTIKAGITNLNIDEDEIYSYIRNGFFFKSKTPYKNVFEVEAGLVYEIDCQSLDIKKENYFDILDFYKKDKVNDYEHAKETLDEILHKSVKDRLLSSDLEVGAFLSGGIDSSLIVAVASEYIQNLKTFTVKFDGAFDESHLAKLTAKKYNTQHYELSISMNLKDDIEKILLNYGEPFMDSSAIPSYYVSQEAKKYVTVILNGDGADELFGGYRRYVPSANNLLSVASYFSSLTKLLPKPHNKKSIYNYAYRLLAMSGKKGLDFYNSATNDIFEDIYSFENNHTFSEMNSFINSVENENISSLSKMLYMDFNLILQSDLLKKMDIATMAHSLEGRSPFLSKYMLEFVPTLSDKYKINGKTTKYILRDLAKQYLPKELITQPKRGFEVPLKNWVENDLKDNIFDTLGSSCYSQNFIDRNFIDKLLSRALDVSDEKRAKMLWTLYTLEIFKANQ
ncbi:asparagine synthetase [Sulfurimonas gotlandica GD1]|uniref:asparagine synthase (glutamine-hydrolyzing) n=1 Tax=Sulfurimonas gotlandica (strain DSM 19862 / JCM 16533 / GD1) TaxID=929558 RepID=B6BKE4_SULGG|nr:asparagine synthase (glutamine-hydrolyzing) [Sulfurimonas gotlandica]EDZ62331.1 asparagine synthase [Sulfurimonas gotlandica GD1]EHP28999.1 asparagine synthetase [Sulfurimonas gotlandica GD1]